jgi:hypothetical protein
LPNNAEIWLTEGGNGLTPYGLYSVQSRFETLNVQLRLSLLPFLGYSNTFKGLCGYLLHAAKPFMVESVLFSALEQVPFDEKQSINLYTFYDERDTSFLEFDERFSEKNLLV